MNKIVLSFALLATFPLSLCNACMADILPRGHKGVKHEIVFEASEALGQHQIVKLGLHGGSVVKPGEAVRFSDKYRTRFYFVPSSVTNLPNFVPETYSQWPSSDPPIHEIRSVPAGSLLATAKTTVRLATINESGPQLEIVKHEEFNSLGIRVNGVGAYLWIPMVVGFAICALIYIRRKRQTDGQTIE